MLYTYITWICTYKRYNFTPATPTCAATHLAQKYFGDFDGVVDVWNHLRAATITPWELRDPPKRLGETKQHTEMQEHLCPMRYMPKCIGIWRDLEGFGAIPLDNTMPVTISWWANCCLCADVSLGHPLAEPAKRKLLLWSPPSHQHVTLWLETQQGRLVSLVCYLQNNDLKKSGIQCVFCLSQSLSNCSHHLPRPRLWRFAGWKAHGKVEDSRLLNTKLDSGHAVDPKNTMNRKGVTGTEHNT